MVYDIVVVGCGGTGSHYIKELGRLIYGKQGAGHNLRLILVDGDVVEEKNLVRQAFLKQDIGRNKAQVMAEILDQAYGGKAEYYDSYIDSALDLKKMVRNNAVVMLVGCVDNHQCRQSMHKFYIESRDCIYMDSANEFSAGEVVVGSRIGGMEMYPDRCQYFPEVLEAQGQRRSEESCEALNVSEPQHMLTNQIAAWILLVNTMKVLDGEWIGGVFFFDMQKCYCIDRTARSVADDIGGTAEYRSNAF